VLTLLRNERDAEKPSASNYRARYAAARRAAANMSLASRRKLSEVYLEAADQAAAVVRDTLERGLSKLTAERWAAMERKLRAAADGLAQGTETIARALVGQAAPLFPEVDADYLFRAGQFAGAKDITRAGLERMVTGIESRVMASLTSRLWADGHTFSERVWSTGTDGRGRPFSVRGDWMERIRMTVAAGIAQGRDPVKIAKDIQVYTADGLVALSQRWGGLERGTSAFAKRLPGKLDWRAQRLVRSELYASLQDASALAGQANPGCDGLYDWVLQVGRKDFGCDCADVAAAGPYRYENLPEYRHPNCGCWIRPHLRDQVQFLGDLKRWAKGESVDYLDDWYKGPYQAAA
jgi:hypothetical protein